MWELSSHQCFSKCVVLSKFIDLPYPSTQRRGQKGMERFSQAAMVWCIRCPLQCIPEKQCLFSVFTNNLECIYNNIYGSIKAQWQNECIETILTCRNKRLPITSVWTYLMSVTSVSHLLHLPKRWRLQNLFTYFIFMVFHIHPTTCFETCKTTIILYAVF